MDADDRSEHQRTRYLLKGGALPLLKAMVAMALRAPSRWFGALRLADRHEPPGDRPLPFHLIYFAEACLLAQWLRHSDARHLHAHFGTNPAEVAMLAHALGGPGYSFTVHGPEEFDRPQALKLREKSRHAAFVAAISSYGRSQLFRWVDAQDWPKIQVVHCGLERSFHDGATAPLPAAPRLVCVGRLCEQKGQLLLVDALHRLKLAGVACELVLAGDGEMRADIERRISQHGLGPQVTITGWISSDRVRELILEARALVLPSFAEGLPVVLMEAMALRRPVITTFVAGIPELVIDGENGWLVPAGDVDALARAMTTCLTSPLPALAAMGRARADPRHRKAQHRHRSRQARCSLCPRRVGDDRMSALELAWGLLTALLAVPALMLWLQVVAAVWPGAQVRATRSTPAAPEAARPRIAVLVPAHNERAGIQATLNSILPQLRAGDRLLVVADNCTDDTARLAAEASAEVAERFDAVRRGKGYALDHGVRQLAADPPEILVMLDADCQAHPGTIDALVAETAASGRPGQALYLMEPPTTAVSGQRAGLKVRAAQFAWRVKNHVRPLGLWRACGPCQLMGTGMSFPWPLIVNAPLASGHLVEDMQLGIDLGLTGRPPRFVPQALVTSTFPDTDAAATSQRTRWEHGHIATLFQAGPRLLWAGLTQGRGSVAVLALDLMVPPLALLLMAQLLLAVVNVLAWAALGWGLPLAISTFALVWLGSGVLLAWAGFGRDIVSFAELASAPLYALRKLPIYSAFLKKRQAEWVRAKRHDE